MTEEMFAGRLRELRIKAGLSQSELAEKVDLHVRQISRMETAAQVPTWPVVLALCAALGVDCTAFTLPASPSEPPKRGRPPKKK